MSFSRSFFGFKPSQVKNTIENMENEHQQKAGFYNEEIEKIKAELKDAQAKHDDLEKQLEQSLEKERMISEVMIVAQSNAQRIEEQARDKASQMLENADRDLQRKTKELQALSTKVGRFKEEFREVLDNYRVSLERIHEKPDEPEFVPTVISKGNKMTDKSS